MEDWLPVRLMWDYCQSLKPASQAVVLDGTSGSKEPFIFSPPTRNDKNVSWARGQLISCV